MTRHHNHRSSTKEVACSKCGELFHSESRCPYVLRYENMSVYNGDEVPHLKGQIKALVDQLNLKDLELKRTVDEKKRFAELLIDTEKMLKTKDRIIDEMKCNLNLKKRRLDDADKQIKEINEACQNKDIELRRLKTENEKLKKLKEVVVKNKNIFVRVVELLFKKPKVPKEAPTESEFEALKECHEIS